jgi:hypothetical protein
MISSGCFCFGFSPHSYFSSQLLSFTQPFLFDCKVIVSLSVIILLTDIDRALPKIRYSKQCQGRETALIENQFGSAGY